MNTKASACLGKQTYPSKAAAEAVIRRKRRIKQKQSGRVIRSFKCPYCNEWHLGSTPRKPKSINAA